jgi:hypothetical protein
MSLDDEMKTSEKMYPAIFGKGNRSIHKVSKAAARFI